MTVLEFSIPTAWALTSNQRLHWAVKGRRTRDIRHLASLEARGINTPVNTPCTVQAELGFETSRRRDAANWYPTIKAAIDGCVDSLWISDDSDEQISSVSIKPYERRQQGFLWIRLTFSPGPVDNDRSDVGSAAGGGER